MHRVNRVKEKKIDTLLSVQPKVVRVAESVKRSATGLTTVVRCQARASTSLCHVQNGYGSDDRGSVPGTSKHVSLSLCADRLEGLSDLLMDTKGCL
jgi:hypothetical protein